MSFVFRMFGIFWVLPGGVLDLLFGWYNGFGSFIRRFGTWFLPVFFGSYGGSGIVVFLRIWNVRSHNFKNFFPILYMIGLKLGDTPDLFLLLHFWILSTPPRSFLICNLSPLLCSCFMHT